jgi:sugar-specific transcriptional regulator TrmB
MEIEQALKEYGLTEKEIKVYLELLPLGSINLQEIAKRIDFPRTTIYNTLNYLHQKGLVSKIMKKSVTYFEAVEPKKLIDKIEERKKLLEAALPKLELLKSAIKTSSHAELYGGNRGIFTILSDVFKIQQEVCYFGSYSLSLEVLKHQPEHVATMRIENKIPARIVIDKYDEERFHTEKYKNLTKMRFLESLKDFPCMIFIYGDKVAIYTLKTDLVGVIIKNKEVAQAMQMIFETYWDISKPARL